MRRERVRGRWARVVLFVAGIVVVVVGFLLVWPASPASYGAAMVLSDGTARVFWYDASLRHLRTTRAAGIRAATSAWLAVGTSDDPHLYVAGSRNGQSGVFLAKSDWAGKLGDWSVVRLGPAKGVAANARWEIIVLEERVLYRQRGDVEWREHHGRFSGFVLLPSGVGDEMVLAESHRLITITMQKSGDAQGGSGDAGPSSRTIFEPSESSLYAFRPEDQLMKSPWGVAGSAWDDGQLKVVFPVMRFNQGDYIGMHPSDRFVWVHDDLVSGKTFLGTKTGSIPTPANVLAWQTVGAVRRDAVQPAP